MPRPIAESQIPVLQVVDLYTRHNWSIRQLAKPGPTGISYTAVRNLLIREGATLRQRGGQSR